MGGISPGEPPRGSWKKRSTRTRLKGVQPGEYSSEQKQNLITVKRQWEEGRGHSQQCQTVVNAMNKHEAEEWQGNEEGVRRGLSKGTFKQKPQVR